MNNSDSTGAAVAEKDVVTTPDCLPRSKGLEINGSESLANSTEHVLEENAELFVDGGKKSRTVTNVVQMNVEDDVSMGIFVLKEVGP